MNGPRIGQYHPQMQECTYVLQSYLGSVLKLLRVNIAKQPRRSATRFQFGVSMTARGAPPAILELQRILPESFIPTASVIVKPQIPAHSFALSLYDGLPKKRWPASRTPGKRLRFPPY
jgi:hypothetical protein